MQRAQQEAEKQRAGKGAVAAEEVEAEGVAVDDAELCEQVLGYLQVIDRFAFSCTSTRIANTICILTRSTDSVQEKKFVSIEKVASELGVRAAVCGLAGTGKTWAASLK